MLFSSLTYTETDEQLMERFVSKKSEKAFEELYRRYAPRLKGFFIRMMSGDVALADDFLQESYFSAFMKHGVVIRLESNSPHGLLPLHIIFVRMNTGTVK